MAVTNPYAAMLKVDPAKEREVLARLKTDQAQMIKLGLAPDEDFSKLKSDPLKYNKVLSYVKSEAYKSPAYGALAEGKTAPEFVEQQTQESYGATPTEYKKTLAPKLEQQYGVDPLRQRAQTYGELAYSAPGTIREEVKKKGGYDIDALKKANDEAVTNFLDVRDKYTRGEVSRSEFIKAVSSLSTASRSLAGGQSGLEEETQKALGQFKESGARAQNAYDNAYKQYLGALEMETQGYEESRTEKRKAAEAMFDAVKGLLDTSRKEEKEYQAAQGRIYNPTTGKYEAKPGTGTGAKSKMFAKADAIRKDLQDGKVDWGQAFNRIKAEFPSVSDKDIDAALGGSAGYNPGTGQFEPEKATGFARAGARGAGGEYFAAPDASGATKYFFGDPKNPATARAISAEEYNRGKYKPEEEQKTQVTDVLSKWKDEGFEKGEIRDLVEKKYGFVPDFVDEWLDEQF